MGKRLHIIGLGPAGLDKLSVGSYRRLLQADKVFARTLKHPCIEDLRKEGVNFVSFDPVYEEEDSFEAVYERIVAGLQAELEEGREVVYVVPGHPYVAEKTVRMLAERLSPEVEIIAEAAVSFLDEIFTSLKLDPTEGLVIKDYDGLRDAGLTGEDWVIIPQVYDALVASNVKLDLMLTYPDDALAFVVKGLGTDQAQTREVPLYELDHEEYDYLTSVVLPPEERVASFRKLTEIMEKLRSPGGCPWDREQTHVSLKPYLIEESYEVLEAIENQDMYNLCEELGDLLLQVVFHAQIAHEANVFTVNDVLREITEKLVRRHPHVFANGKANTSGEVVRAWEEIKKEEKKDPEREKDYFKEPKGLPSLMLAQATQGRAAKFGFDWPDWQGPWQKIHEELGELQGAMAEGDGIKEELGDVLFAVVNLARFLNLDAEEALRASVHKFQSRFRKMSELAAREGRKLEGMSLGEMNLYWELAKTHEKSGKVAWA
ncbi:MAG: nucleoside triphosphate pyrophosphohydrolase [Desulfitobacteriaceae bacterium]|nr:nucleoside triphosphate pyrophosphohydrolase [Desulfitobacteriaceae bacterium]MDI6878054.1 nucleoside triphosphate pyrophosphohydrolase [Desulfitobacteriaceae bacterium]MDI6913924.1 nucleoside triphosphate pyrophosphohydrolase [Desulfitobacteriaceae bacterium]